MKVLECCEKNKVLCAIRWYKPNNFCGPEEEGWAIGLHGWGDVSLENIRYCPFCGYEVPNDN